jgi:4-diphosphocytidyl-2C-methyl-D-erythritol kinase
MTSLRVKSHAKINLGLEVLGLLRASLTEPAFIQA